MVLWDKMGLPPSVSVLCMVGQDGTVGILCNYSF
jgi:hypothetical protein